MAKWWNGRRAGLKIQWAGRPVRVRVPFSLQINNQIKYHKIMAMKKIIGINEKDYTLNLDYSYPKTIGITSATIAIKAETDIPNNPYFATYTIKNRHFEPEMKAVLEAIEYNFIEYINKITKKESIFAQHGWK